MGLGGWMLELLLREDVEFEIECVGRGRCEDSRTGTEVRWRLDNEALLIGQEEGKRRDGQLKPPMIARCFPPFLHRRNVLLSLTPSLYRRWEFSFWRQADRQMEYVGHRRVELVGTLAPAR